MALDLETILTLEAMLSTVIVTILIALGIATREKIVSGKAKELVDSNRNMIIAGFSLGALGFAMFMGIEIVEALGVILNIEFEETLEIFEVLQLSIWLIGQAIALGLILRLRGVGVASA